MSDLLKRDFAPLADAAWTVIDEAVARVLKAQLTARTLVDFKGPLGWEFAAVNLGRLDVSKQPAAPGVPWGLRTVLPLLEVRVPFTLRQWELDNAARGAADVDLSAAEDAARKVAQFEDGAIYRGFAEGQVNGILSAPKHGALRLPGKAAEFPGIVSEAIGRLRTAGVGGPYALALSNEAFQVLAHHGDAGYPAYRVVHSMLGGPIVASGALEGGVVLSTRGGDFELTVGQDLSVGYQYHDKENVELYVTESFTFRVVEPAAAVPLARG